MEFMVNRVAHNINFIDTDNQHVACHNIHQPQTRGNNGASINATTKTAINIILGLYTRCNVYLFKACLNLAIL